ncbi:hypothetical protein RBH26_15760 [Natronolimnohabitans sp. A-GB9]|uniref:hypothetical protein n=1 Tax=Natronolimnohabitans sp. A-GB9 TaxID=3069757 RepID=UPI0027ADFEEF|nr:hypothetical protein [Natronolimnohabitans sp. A-GB9]MDQ2051934.1 hypothetical protein [Natronolimnohabitans sp. A-GB9]
MSDTHAHSIGVTLENRLMSHGIYLTSWQPLPPDADEGGDGASNESADIETTDGDLPDGVGLAVEYETVSESPVVDSNEVGAVVRTLLDIADERDWTPGRFEATSYSTDGELRGQWHVERAWFDGLGLEIDDLEFSQRVLGTIGRTDDASAE